MKIRVEGTSEQEIQKFIRDSDTKYTVVNVSKFYPNRGNTRNGRVYIDFEM
ncbi:DUF3970 family protein [Ammoniphilus sp. 3BR4]|uniref:DUF3970 family protein n=1 Tax=Ammoniphilus sp. 3BR4 TaxID=3158265 RepID=UPI003467BB22